jgi:AAA domain (dynein-related subfamily)
MGNYIHAFSSVALAKSRALGNANLPIEKYRDIFKYIKFSNDPVEKVINNLLNKTDATYYLPFFGESSISELVFYAKPNDNVIYNRRSIVALKVLGVDFPEIKGESLGDKFKRYNEILGIVLEKYQEIVGARTNTTIPLEVDQFFSWIYKSNDRTRTFQEIIDELRLILENDDSIILNEFTISPAKKNPKFFWIQDHKKVIGDQKAHYEIIQRHKKLYVELHFEGDKKENDIFYKSMLEIPKELRWFKWQNSQSLGIINPFDMASEHIVDELKNGLLFLEQSVGDDIRKIINPKQEEQMQDYTINDENPQPLHPLNQILFGPPGTGKTYNTINKALEIVNPEFYAANKDNRKELKTEFDRLLIKDWDNSEGQIAFCTFHQSMSYEDFIEGIKPTEPVNDGDNVNYRVENGVFKKMCIIAQKPKIQVSNFEDAYQKLLSEIKQNNGKLVLETLQQAREFTIYENSKGNLRFHANTEKAYEGVIKKEIIAHYLLTGEALDWPSYTKSVGKYLANKLGYSESNNKNLENFVLIIDEINRGNVSQIFGELITLIEDNKRLGAKEALELTLPYSKKSFGVPSNLHIIGTMNTADRSVEALDTALRRRFNFEEIPPQYDVIKTEGKLKASEGKLTLDDNLVVDLVKILETINNRIEVLLSRDNLIGHSYFLDVDSEKALKKTFFKNIIPLLQEYFYGDYGKIGLVLGNGFVKLKRDENKSKMVFAQFKEYEDTEGVQKRVYELISEKEINIKAALKSLLNGES